MDYGCSQNRGVEGLIHNSELDWVNKNVKPSKILSVGQKVSLKLLTSIKKLKEFLYL